MSLALFHCRRSLRLLSSIAIVMSWLAGPCHAASAVLLLAVAGDADHEVAVCEAGQSTTITLRHHRGTDGSCGSHCHRGLTAWLVSAPGSPGGQHPDHVFQIRSGLIEETEQGKVAVLSEMDGCGQDYSPPMPAFMGEVIWHVNPRAIRFSNDQLARIPCGFSPPRSAVLLI